MLLRRAANETDGHILDVCHTMAKAFRSNLEPNLINNSKPLLGLDDKDIRQASESLLRNGYYVSPRVVQTELLDEFEAAAVDRIIELKSDDYSNLEKFSEGVKAREEMVTLGADWVLEQPLSIALASCPNVIEIARNYLGVDPILNLPESWFSFPVDNLRPMSAQNWHWDCDRIRWLKVFVYVTDVISSNGPHSFVSGSHRHWRVPSINSRASAEDINASYLESDLKTFLGPRGTVIFEDTRGFHKGTPLTSGHRLILQLEFATDEFGNIHPTFHLSKSAAKKLAAYPNLIKHMSVV